MENATASLALLREIHEYARVEFQVYVAWFTFFLTLLLGTMAWSLRASLDRQGKVVNLLPFYCMLVLFSVQLLLGIVGTEYVLSDLKHGEEQALVLQQSLIQQTAEITQRPALATELVEINPFPQGITKAIRLMQGTLASNLIFWAGVAILANKRKGKKLAGAN